MTSIRDTLIAARERIDTPEKWSGGGTRVRSDRLTILGVLSAVEAPERAYLALRRQLRNGFNRLAPFNAHPSTTHADVIPLFDRAIAAQEKTHRVECHSGCTDPHCPYTHPAQGEA